MHWEEDRDAAQHRTMQRTAPKQNDLEQNVNCALVEEPLFILIV